MPKRRPYTAAERAEVYRLRRKGRLGQLNSADSERVTELFNINPDEYGEAAEGAIDEVDATVNPLLRKDDD